MTRLPFKLSALLSLIFFFITLSNFAQATKKVKIRSADKNTIETYYVLKSDENIRHGRYELKKYKKLHTSGEYFHGKPSGDWIIGNENHNLSFKSSFLEDKKNGKWTYLVKGKTSSEIYYANGRTDSAFARNAEGSPLVKLTLDKDGNGESLAYFENGQVRSSFQIKEYNINGECTMYYPNGQVFTRMHYLGDRPINIYETYHSDGTIIESEPFQNGTGKHVHYVLNGEGELQIEQIAHFKDSVLHGAYELYDTKGVKTYYGNYHYGHKTGIWVRGSETETYEVTDVPQKFQPDENPAKDKIHYVISSGFSHIYSGFTVLERMPEYPGGDTKLISFLGENIRYPEMAKAGGVQGRVYITFVIDEMGFVTEQKILRSVHPDLDSEAMRVVNILPRWNPGMQLGLPVKVQYNLPINFRLTN